jgi:hypothetical protein
MTQRQTTDTLARGLGWFSIALGAAELVAPKAISRALGMEHRAGLVRAYGLREIANGIAILSSAKRKPWLWGRVAGDALDLATLAGGNRRARMAMGGAAAIAALDIYVASREPETPAMGSMRDYSDRSAFPDTPENMRGKAVREQSKVRDATILNPLI